MSVIQFLFIPVTAGIVGFLTNALAIRMLFRPYTPKWYTLGWQGIVPRTRKKLAKGVANIVGEKLLTAEVIADNTKSYEFKERVSHLFEKLLRFIQNKDDVTSFLELFLSDKKETFEKLSSAVSQIVIEHIKGMRVSELSEGANILSKPAVRQHLSALLEKYIHGRIYILCKSEKPIAELFPELPMDELAERIADIIIPNLKNICCEESVKKLISAVLIQYKKEQFRDSFSDQMKKAAVNMMLPDERIKQIVEERLPEIGGKLAQDNTVRRSIKNLIAKKISEIAVKEDLVWEKIPGILAHEFMNGSLTDFITNCYNLREHADESIGGIFEKNGIDIGDIVPLKICIKSLVCDNYERILSWISVLIKSSEDKIPVLISRTAPDFLSFMNVSKMVEDKINSLDMAEVEDMLFSFMKAHFKWINAMGFVIGFLAGIVQILFIKL